MRHPDLCALEAADESAAVIARGPEEDLSDPLLELLVAKALGLLNDPSSLRNSEAPGLRRSSSRAIARVPCTSSPSILAAGTVSSGNPRALRTTHETTGRRSVRL